MPASKLAERKAVSGRRAALLERLDPCDPGKAGVNDDTKTTHA